MKFPTISIILPRREQDSSEQAIQAVLHSDYPSECLEIIETIGNHPSTQRNRAAAMAQGELLYFLDNDSFVSPMLFRQIARHYDTGNPQEIIAVGGPNVTPDTDSILQQLAGHALASPFAHAKMAARYVPSGGIREAGEQELILCNLSIRRDIFLKEGGFNEELYPNEENEFITRLRRKGYRFLYDPNVVVSRSRRTHVGAFMRQMFGYGRGRARQTLVEGFSRHSLLFFLPSTLLLYLCALPFLTAPFGRMAWCPGIVYVSGAVGSALFQCGWRQRYWKFVPLLPFWFLLMHLSYGAGMLYGFAAPHPPRKPGAANADIRLVRRKTLSNR
ncbi:hypothetical protein U14_00015 [Candidatus Moduliflexus flocculans]|uniref:Glycosyltransferase 2-like domain-containing protein n=1 Tax=Candidatus Moduliflexus flocculans TaxID=1499966 RepID=A0A0S6VP58_9BACT|nr:hypothetical protein U14_00015 [Candidatus Moduliflexus flocculans]